MLLGFAPFHQMLALGVTLVTNYGREVCRVPGLNAEN